MKTENQMDIGVIIILVALPKAVEGLSLTTNCRSSVTANMF